MVNHNLTRKSLPRLPAFVRQHLDQLIKDDCQFEEEEEERIEQEQRLLAGTRYVVVEGSIDHPYKNVSKQIHFWIASHDSARIHLYIGGSGCWMTPSSHYLFFSPVAGELLPPKPDRQTWWAIVIGEQDSPYSVYRICVRPESEVADNFPDIG
jgi:hypothetical protein